MLSALAFFSRSVAAARSVERQRLTVGLLVALHLAALAVLIQTETNLVPKIVFLFVWGLLNGFWLLVLRRPAISAGLSLGLIVILIALSRFKHDVVLMTASFVDVMVIDSDTASFLFTVFPKLRWIVTGVAALAAPALALLWWIDPIRVRRRAAALLTVGCLAGLSAIALTMPIDRETQFYDEEYVSKFVRTAITSLVDLSTNGLLQSDAIASGSLGAVAPASCPSRPPHIVMVLDESSFDISAVPGIKVPPGYQHHFDSFDGAMRSLFVEGAGGPTWYTEYNVLTGLSTRSFGRFADFVTRIAAGHITRSLPNALHQCGYRTYSMYPWFGAFLGARRFQETLGIDHFLDAKNLKAEDVEPDSFYYDYAANLIGRERAAGQPLFVLTYLMANHFPWDTRYRADLATDWRDLGNGVVDGHRVDEYLRRQEMSARDYKAFVAKLKRDFPDEPFLIVRFGDHQPLFAKKIIDPTLDDAAIGRRIEAGDPRYFKTYYAIDAVNFKPHDLASARDGLDASYLPLVILEAASVPLDASFAEQRRILKRCNGLFYLCADGAETRRFNRLLIDAGLIKRL